MSAGRGYLALAALIACVVTTQATHADGIPDHPSKLVYPELSYQAPSPKGMRHVLDNGMVLWWAEDAGAAGLPALFQLNAFVRTSRLLDPAEGRPRHFWPATDGSLPTG